MKKEKLIAARKVKMISQCNIATYLKISQPQYQKRETGKIEITDQEWNKIAQLLEIEVEVIKEETNFSMKNEDAISNNDSGNNSRVPIFYLESQKKYVENLQLEIQKLKVENKNL